jgi:peptidoglycan hydrolase-like protein with peptidoglycan-binding domain
VKIVMSSGHGSKISGAVDIINEHDEAVRVVDRTAEYLRQAGVDCVTYEDTVSTNQDDNLERIVGFHNSQGPHDLDISVHFNSSNGTTSKPIGTEVFSYDDDALAATVSEAIADAGDFIDRGAKDGSGLYFCRNTAENALLLEICFVNSQADCSLYEQNFDAICHSIAEALSGEAIAPGPTPPPQPEPEPPPGEHPTLKRGDNNADVAELQEALGVLIADGDFGSITETWVRAFQAACGLKADGVVGPVTWEAIEDLEARKAAGGPRLPERLIDRIVALAEESEIQEFLWPDRGMTPPGYIPGMALSFAYALRQFEDGDDAATIMAKAQGGADKDALAFYDSEFKKLNMSNKTAGIDTLRHLFVMMIGLGPRESSARYVEGRDLSASNVQSDTCEAGLFQTSWNIRNGSDAIEPLLDDFWQNPNGFREQFKLDVYPTADNLNCYGAPGDDGVRYQWLSRFAPLFHVMVTGVGMRVLRAHWGPIGRREVTLKKEADDLLKDVQALIEAVA